MTLRWYTLVIDCIDIAAQARWWAEVLDWRIVYEDEHEVAVIPRDMSEDPIDDVETWLRTGPALVFVPVPEGKEVKNRLHIDLAPHIGQDREAEIDRLLAMGATKVNVGQNEKDVTWIVLADPEGNEFCVLSSRDR
ncbi:MAG: VOC family protein [Dermatophilus congolensis]|nr:VOC family protein [Dermatophilus congolensis]